MSPADRLPLGKAGRTNPEIEAAIEAKSEKELQRQIGQYLRMKGLVFDPQPWGKKTTAPEGWPDFSLPWQGGFLGLEAKGPKGKQTEAQLTMERRIKEQGGRYYTVRSLDEVKRILEQPRME